MNYPNIYKIYEATISKDKKYIEVLSEFAEEGNLQMKLDDYECDYQHFSESNLIDWLNQICMALNYIHSQKILHRNIKPSCIIMIKPGFVKLGDFGFNKVISKNGNLKRIKTMRQNIQYTAPEIYENKNFSEKTDIWLLGVTFFELMTFNFAFKGKNDDEKMDSILSDNINEFNYPYSDNLKQLICRMISKDPDKRPTPREILDMEFIQKRMECYINENDNHFLKAQKTLRLFEDAEEIETVQEITNENAEDKKKEIKIVESNNNEEKKEENKEDNKEDNKKNEKENNKEDNKEDKKEDKKEDNKEENKDNNKGENKENNKEEKDSKKPKKEKKVRFVFNEEEIKKKQEKNKNKKARKFAEDLIKQIGFMKEIIKK